MRLLFGTRGVRGTTSGDDDTAPLSCCSRLATIVVVLTICCCCFCSVVDGFPAVQLRHDGNLPASTVSKTVEFLTRYGYLPPSDPNTGNLRSESEFRGAIAAMQRFGGLAPTGRIDAETVALMEARRCGVPDYLSADDRWRVRRYAIQGQKWPSTNLTWSVKSESPSSDLPMVRAQLRRAFSVWSEASALTFSEVTTTTRGSGADIIVSFLKGPHGDGYPFDGEGSVLAHAFFPGEGIGGDAHFDAEERWLPTEPDDDEGVNLFAVAAHEIGHSLGLSHSSTPGSLMFPYYQIIGQQFQLPQDDADGIRHLYGIKDIRNEPTMPSLAPTTSMPETTTPKKSKLTTKKATHKSKKTTLPTKKASLPAPNICNSSIDAISVIRREIFVFKGNHFWRLHTNRTLREGYPVSIDRFWYDLPPNISRVDALYERPSDTKIVFFSGRNYWVFSANQLEPEYPKPLTDLGLPEDVDHIDAAMVWGHNGKTYLFSGTQYWKFDEEEHRVELDYPRSITAWRGIPSNIDAAFQWTDGNTYFFKSNKFWKFVDVKMRVEKKTPSEIGGFWFHCPSKKTEKATTVTTEVLDTDVQPVHTENDSSTIHIALSYLYLLFLVLFIPCHAQFINNFML